ncbi:hypothetical protein DE146DRAFT_682915 [Phaeosphaeria sp. MPI-PUGE-AT-0046c]|nr:hypothetical protein DE146DRAFT_682915 [Phaeosphaeria sp. MPI-PUGE-AT-0046c]
MDATPIAELHPELPARDSKTFKAAVTLIWPYSSSQRQFALLLAEPDFRLRRKKGQVRARFSGSSARALATTGVGIGDEVVLSLRGAKFLQEDTVSTPGRSIDWELEYTQNVSVQVFRHGHEIAIMELVDAAPTPAPRSPRRQSNIVPTPTQQWTSPAFLKRIRLSDGPFFEAPYDPVLDENAEGHDSKRRRRSYRDWKAWTYSARTPSPEKGEFGVEVDFESMEPSPTRRTQLPRTPISPQRPSALSVAVGPLQDEGKIATGDRDEAPNISANLDGADDRNALRDRTAQLRAADDFVRDEVYYDLYAGPNESRPADAQYAFGGDTEANTEEDEMEDTDAASMSSTEVNSEDLADSYLRDNNHEDAVPASTSALLGAGAGSTTEEGSLLELSDTQHSEESLQRAEDAPILVMPPPILPTLNTNLQAPMFTGTLTPIGKEPKSPTLQPLDSALLPLPSPFPGEQDANNASYFDQVPFSDQPEAPQQVEEEPQVEADYILENSFFSSINSSKASALHPNHESAFTPLRFTFGMDSVGSPKPMELSSPPPQSVKDDLSQGLQHGGLELAIPQNTLDDLLADAGLVEDHQLVFSAQEQVSASVAHASSPLHDDSEGLASKHHPAEAREDEPNVIELSSDSEEIEVEEELAVGEGSAVENVDGGREPSIGTVNSAENKVHSEETTTQNDTMPASTRNITAVSNIIDNGSPQVSAPRSSESRFTPHGTLEEDQSELDDTNIAAASLEEPVDARKALAHVSAQEELQAITLSDFARQEFVSETFEHPSETTDTYMEDNFLHNMSSDVVRWESQDIEEDHPDIKLESIEEAFISHYNDSSIQQESAESLGDAPGEILIEIPDEGHKIGELHTIAVPATGPARNTRSKTKNSAPSTSPTKEEFSPPKRSTMSTRSKASATPTARTTMSPPRMRTRSTMSPAHDPSQTSPYSLRSQSKLLSPTQSTFVEPTTRRSPRKHASQRSVDSIPDLKSSQVVELDPFLTSFQPSQELGESQGRYSHIAAVKDSEDESLRPEHSFSTARYSDDWNTFTNFSDPIMDIDQDTNAANLKPPPASAPEARVAPADRARGDVSAGQARLYESNSPADVRFSFTSQAALVSPGRKLRSARSMEAAPTSPLVSRSTRDPVRISSSPAARETSDEVTPKAQDVTYPPLPGQSGVVELLSPTPASGNFNEPVGSSPPPTVMSTPTSRQKRVQNKNRLVTPELSQQSAMESQDQVVDSQQQKSALLTPQLTQATSAGAQSFNASMENASTIVVTSTKGSPNVVTRSTPRRNTTQTDQPEGPSIGLSTPLAYYTPLNSLIYFLNRSSQFHTSSNPDVLALVTSATTTPVRATKGRKDWTTTFHITDISTYPSTTTVNIFRPNQIALPAADAGDVILVRAFAVKSINRHPTLTSADESSWCVWRYKKPVWGAKRGAFGELKAREEVKGPQVERGEGEWREVERLRGWWLEKVQGEIADKVHTRSQDKEKGVDGMGSSEGVKTRSQDKKMEE